MMRTIEMHFYITRNKDGSVHVQNAVMGKLGQHHVHSNEGFEKWKQDVDESCIKELGGGECDCGLKIGDVKDHHGDVRHTEGS